MKPKIFTQPSLRKGNGIQRLLRYVLVAFLIFCSTALQAQDVLIGLTSNGGPEGMGTAFSFKTDASKAFSVIKGFADWGANPVNSLVRASDGQLYGMVPNGGTYGYGTLFRISPAGDMTILKQFNGEADGGYPKGSLIQAKDGWLYGMTTVASSGYAGTIFKISPTTGQFIVIKMLNMNVDGGRPSGHLVEANDGNFYGITRAGGNNGTGYGTIFRLKTDGTYSVLKVLNGTTDGGSCYGSLMQASNGVFYGMTHSGGTSSYGVIFRYSTVDGYKVIKSLNASVDAGYPDGDLVEKSGYLYGMAATGIGYNGVAIKIKLDGTSFGVIHKFDPSLEGGNPGGSLVLGTDGYFYGILSIRSGGYGGGVFKMSTSGSTSSIKKFTPATEGSGSLGSLVQLPDGYFYGMTQYGGKNDDGTIFKVSASGTTFNVLAHMNGATMGNAPQDNLALGKDSAYFGTTYAGGTYNQGTIFKICGGVTTVLRSFNRNADGGNPTGGLVRGKDGNLYGTTEGGGTNGGGTIFRITPSGTFTVLRHLKSTTDGSIPKGTLALASGTDSSLYGTTYSGGTNGGGTIFKITQKGTFTVLHHFAYATDGDHSEAGLVFKTDAFYGMTSSATRFYKITTGGQFSVIKTLTYGTDGGYPLGNMIVGTDGSLYGTMSLGGTYGKGVIFKITTGGSMTKLKHLNGTTEGAYPKGSLVQASDGAFYGTTFSGGANGVGTIFKVTSGSTFTLLKSFDMAKDGGNSISGMTLAPKITLVATAQSGLTTTEDVAKAITLTGTGTTNLTFNVLIKPRNGSVSTGTGAARTYTPNPNFNGVDSFAFTSNLGCLASAPAWVKITVSSVNDAPVLTTIGSKSVVKDTQLKFIAMATDVDAGQTKTFSLISAPAGATISATTGTFTWTPTTTGSFTFKVRVTDNGSPVLYDEETITVTVTATTLTATTAVTTLTESKIAEPTKIAEATLYPNPVVSNFTINLNKTSKDVKLTIVDMKGATVYSKQYNGNAQQLQVNAAKLQSGGYIVLLQTDGAVQTLKFVKQ